MIAVWKLYFGSLTSEIITDALIIKIKKLP